MRLKSRALTRSWLVLTAAFVTVLPAATPALASDKKLPHAVGGYVPGATRTPAKAQASASEVLPASVDLREYAPAVSDQGQIGACVAWTIGYSIMGYYANRTGGSGAPYAPLFLYMRNVAKGGAPSAGLNPDSVLANAQTAGVDTQESYWQGTTNWQTAPTQAQVDNAKNYRVNGWSRLFNGANQGAAAQTAIMRTLSAGSPVALGIPVFRDFMYLRSHSLYSTTSGTNLGGHMVAVYGYDAQGVYLRNSWGGVWGNGGDAHLSWSFITKAATGAYAVNGSVTPANPVAMAPTVGALSTAKAAPGTAVTITGAGLSSVTSVSFGGTDAEFTAQTSNGLTKLVAVAPAHSPGVVDITVTNPSGTSAAGPTSKFTFIPPPPGITALSPDTASVLGGTTVTLSGANLAGVTAVKLGTISTSARVLNPTTLTFVAPARTAPGTVAVTVTNAYGTSTPAGQLSYANPAAPTVTSITPATGLTYKRTAVVLKGTDLGSVSKVLLGETSVAYSKVSATELKLTLPLGTAGALGLRVFTRGGTSTVDGASTFTFVAPDAPAITSVVPASGLTYLRTPVVLNGENFTDATKLTVAGVSVPFTKVSATQVKAVLPVRPAGAADVQLTTPGGVASGAQFTYAAPPVPVISSLSTSIGRTKIVTPLTVTGTGLTAATKVLVGTVSVGFTKVSDTQLTLRVPARTTAGDAPVTVTTPGGVSDPAPFRFEVAPVPAVSELQPTFGAANRTTTLYVTGSGFTGATRLTLGGAAISFTPMSDTTLKVMLPARAAGSYALVVTTPGGSTPIGTTFDYYK
jgi:hypothetical protein